MALTAVTQNFLSSLTGNVPKAMLYVRKPQTADTSMESVHDELNEMQQKLLKSTEDWLNGLAGDNKIASQTLKSVAGAQGIGGDNYLALEVQYNPNSIQMETVEGVQVQYSGGALGNAGNNQLIQSFQPPSTTMALQLIFDDMNPADAFMLTKGGNVVSSASDVLTNVKNGGYSVQNQMDGLVSLLTSPITRQVIFFWAKMCFRGEVTSVSSHYTMFNKSGSPIRGEVSLTIRQENDTNYETMYWNQAFTRAFGEETQGAASTFTKFTNNNILNLNL